MSKVIAMYLPNWAGYQRRLQDFDPIINTVYMFHATPADNGNLNFQPLGGTFLQDARAFIASGRRIVLTVGGANAGFSLDNRQQSNNFVASFRRINDSMGNIFSGLDWNNFEAHVQPSTEEMIYVSRTLRDVYGTNFRISSPPAPWRAADRSLGAAMARAGVLDNGGYFGPQYYDGPGLTDPDYIVNSVAQWVEAMGDARKVCVGFGVANAGNYSSGESARGAMQRILARWPNIGGCYNWEANYDNSHGTPFCRQVATVLGTQSLSTTPVVALASDANWTFLQGRDSWDGVSSDQRLTGMTVEQMKAQCMTSGAQGFNTNGYVKQTLVQPYLTEPTFTRADQGLFVRKVVAPVVAPSTSLITDITLSGNDLTNMTGSAMVLGKKYNFAVNIKLL